MLNASLCLELSAVTISWELQAMDDQPSSEAQGVLDCQDELLSLLGPLLEAAIPTGPVPTEFWCACDG